MAFRFSIFFFVISCDCMYLNIFIRNWRVTLPILQETRTECLVGNEKYICTLSLLFSYRN